MLTARPYGNRQDTPTGHEGKDLRKKAATIHNKTRPPAEKPPVTREKPKLGLARMHGP